jgi:hypothetical protein
MRYGDGRQIAIPEQICRHDGATGSDSGLSCGPNTGAGNKKGSRHVAGFGYQLRDSSAMSPRLFSS